MTHLAKSVASHNSIRRIPGPSTGAVEPSCTPVGRILITFYQKMSRISCEIKNSTQKAKNHGTSPITFSKSLII
jgi:hypothetical protein